jgi:hypothetical protein
MAYNRMHIRPLWIVIIQLSTIICNGAIIQAAYPTGVFDTRGSVESNTISPNWSRRNTCSLARVAFDRLALESLVEKNSSFNNLLESRDSPYEINVQKTAPGVYQGMYS